MERNIAYQYCHRTVTQASALWRDICAEQLPAVADILLRRKRDDRVRRLLFDEIRRAFLTPIDREDLWGLCVASEELLRAVEDVAAEIHRQGRERLPDGKAFWAEIGLGCAALQQAVKSFPRFQRQDDTTDALHRWTTAQEQWQKTYDEHAKTAFMQKDLGRLRMYDKGLAVAHGGEIVARQLLTAILKNE